MNVKKIPATISPYTEAPLGSKKKRRVAGYARVSSDRGEQQSSYEAQVDYYTRYINEREDWEFAGVYTDEGISATNTKKRDGFNQMIEDALVGKIDLIITKSVSRFARNTVDSLTTVRELKNKGIEIYFEKENIWTLDAKGELLITIMSSLAQEESRSISENITWGKRKRFAEGKVSFVYTRFLGLDKDEETGKFVVNREQAKIVKLIFRLFLDGMTPYSIAKELTCMGIKTPCGKDVWNQQTIRRMLTNEKYKGDALLQKNFTVDFLRKKKKKNEGEVPQYYVEGNHEAIISPQIFDIVQDEIERRKHLSGARYSGVSIFSTKIKCGDCGAWYGTKVWHSTDKYRKIVYRCNHKYDNKKYDRNCHSPYVTEDEIKMMFVEAFNKLLSVKREVIEKAEAAAKSQKAPSNIGELTAERDSLREETASLADEMQNMVEENARTAQSQEGFRTRYNELAERYKAAKSRHDEIDRIIRQINIQKEKIKIFVNTLKDQAEPISEFDGALWSTTVDFVTIGKDERNITFKDGTVIQI